MGDHICTTWVLWGKVMFCRNEIRQAEASGKVRNHTDIPMETAKNRVRQCTWTESTRTAGTERNICTIPFVRDAGWSGCHCQELG